MAKKEDKNHSGELDSLLKQQISGKATRASRVTHAKGNAAPTLEELLGAAGDTKTRSPEPSTPITAKTGSNQPLDVSLGQNLPQPDSRSTTKQAKHLENRPDLGVLISGDGKTGEMPGAEMAQKNAQKGQSISSIKARYVAVFMVILLAGVYAYSLTPGHVQKPREVLFELIEDIQNYEDKNGVLPSSLVVLPSFPSDAIDWPLEYWSLRNTQGKIEIIWAPADDGSYAVIVREGSESWLRNFQGNVLQLDQ